MTQWEKDVLEITLEMDHWEEPNTLIHEHMWQAIQEPSEMRVKKMDGELVKLKFLKGSIVKIIHRETTKMTYNPSDVIDGELDP